MRHPVVYRQCRRLFQQSLKDSVPASLGATNRSFLCQRFASSLQEPRRFILARNSLSYPPCVRTLSSTAVVSSKGSVSADGIIRSHLPDIEIPDNVSFHQYMFARFNEHKDLPAVEDFLTGRMYTYAQLKENTIRVASALHRLGLRKGDVILCFTANTIDITVLMLACASLGIWYSASNPTFTADELSWQLNDSNSIAIFTLPLLAPVVTEALKKNTLSDKVKHRFCFGECPGFQPFQNLLDDDGKAMPDTEINPKEDVYILPYSSGTTGLPKGVMLTHYNIVANCLQMEQIIKISRGLPGLGLLPLYHIYAMVVGQYCFLQAGGFVSLLPKFEPESFLQCLQDRKIELALLVPLLVTFLAKHPLASKYDLSHLKRVTCAAAPLGEDLTKEFLQKYPNDVVLAQGFGLTETSPAVNFDTVGEFGSVGTMIPNTLGKIVDPDTHVTLGPNQEGEYCVKGPQVMKGYLNNKKATDDMITPDGWLHTGDIGYCNEDGVVYIKDRLKELIKYKGSQVAPAELEALLLGHPDIADVAVIGIPHEEAGEVPKAFVIKKPGANITEEEVVNFVKEKMARSKWLRGGVQFVEEIPRNPSGKILRRIIKQMYQEIAKV